MALFPCIICLGFIINILICGNISIIFMFYFAYITFYFTPKSSKNSVFCKLDMVRLLFCVLTNVLTSLFIICVLSCYNKLLHLCLKLSNHYFRIQIWYCSI
jgi:hypothetical protein